MKDALLEHNKSVSKDQGQHRDALMARYKMLEGYVSRAYEDKLSGLLAEDLWRQKNDGWRAEHAKLTSELGILRDDKDAYMDNAVLMLELAQQSVMLYEKGSAEKKRKLVEIACSNRVLVNGTLRFDYQKPFDILAKVTGKEVWWRRRESNPTSIARAASTKDLKPLIIPPNSVVFLCLLRLLKARQSIDCLPTFCPKSAAKLPGDTSRDVGWPSNMFKPDIAAYGGGLGCTRTMRRVPQK